MPTPEMTMTGAAHGIKTGTVICPTTANQVDSEWRTSMETT
jgi:hypothetical protein